MGQDQVSGGVSVLCWLAAQDRDPVNRLTTSVEWLSLLQLTVLSRSAIVVQSTFPMASLCCRFCFDVPADVGAFVIGLSQSLLFFSHDLFIKTFRLVCVCIWTDDYSFLGDIYSYTTKLRLLNKIQFI